MPNKARNDRKKKLLEHITKEGDQHPSYMEGPLRPTKTEPISSPFKFLLMWAVAEMTPSSVDRDCWAGKSLVIALD